MRRLDGITLDMSLSKLQEVVKDREEWRAAVQGLQRVGHDQATELNWTIPFYRSFCPKARHCYSFIQAWWLWVFPNCSSVDYHFIWSLGLGKILSPRDSLLLVFPLPLFFRYLDSSNGLNFYLPGAQSWGFCTSIPLTAILHKPYFPVPHLLTVGLGLVSSLFQDKLSSSVR